jgi:LemA protein
VKGYAAHEEAVFTNVANARAGLMGAVRSGDSEQMATANAQLTGALGRLFAVVEAYPTLKADQNFLRLQDELTGTENRVAVARNDYNAAVNEYNGYIRKFPQVITAKVTGAQPRKYFQAAPGSTEAPKVDFSKTPTQPPAPPPATKTP